MPRPARTSPLTAPFTAPRSLLRAAACALVMACAALPATAQHGGTGWVPGAADGASPPAEGTGERPFVSNIEGATDPTQVNPLDIPYEERGLTLEERVGARLPLDTQFTNWKGELVPLGSYFDGTKPSVIALVYYRCPIVCDVMMQKLAQRVTELDEYTVGRDFNLLVFSFDPGETYDVAAKLREEALAMYASDRPIDDRVRAGWQYHTSDATSARQLADSLGFSYKMLPNGEFSHPIAIFLATPDGTISRYIYGYPDDTKTLRLAIMEASEGKLVRSLGERFIAFCYMFDPTLGRYTLQAFRVMQVAGVLTLVLLGGLIGGLLIVERLRKAKVGPNSSPPPPPTPGAGPPALAG